MKNFLKSVIVLFSCLSILISPLTANAENVGATSRSGGSFTSTSWLWCPSNTKPEGPYQTYLRDETGTYFVCANKGFISVNLHFLDKGDYGVQIHDGKGNAVDGTYESNTDWISISFDGLDAGVYRIAVYNYNQGGTYIKDYSINWY